FIVVFDVIVNVMPNVKGRVWFSIKPPKSGILYSQGGHSIFEQIEKEPLSKVLSLYNISKPNRSPSVMSTFVVRFPLTHIFAPRKKVSGITFRFSVAKVGASEH
ncbi:7400_t:CDS:1, partial [Racocetra persica]